MGQFGLVVLHTSDVVAMLLLVACFYLGILAAQTELQMQIMRSDEGEKVETDASSWTTAGDAPGHTAWDQLSWDEKMYYMRKKQRYTWGAAGSGAISILGSVLVLGVRSTYNVPGIVPASVIIAFYALVLLMGGYLLNQYVRLYRVSMDAQTKMEALAEHSDMGQKLALLYLGAALAGVIGPAVSFLVVLFGLPIVLLDYWGLWGENLTRY